MEKIYIFAYNTCKRRELDGEKIQNYLLVNKYKIVNDPKDADIILIITCAFIDDKTKITLEKIKEFQENYEAELIVAGCLPVIDRHKLDKIFNGRIITTQDLVDDPDKIDKFFPNSEIKFREVLDSNATNVDEDIADFTEDGLPNFLLKLIEKSDYFRNAYSKLRIAISKKIFAPHSLLYSSSTPESFFIRISWGCNHNCSYCAIRQAIGPHKSKTIEECLDEFKKGLKEGYKNFFITADDTGAYGLDIGSNFPELLDKLTNLPGNYNLAIMDFNPRWIVKYIDQIEKIVNLHKISRFTIHIQSGNPRILKLMNRYSDTKKMKDAFRRLKKAHPNLVLLTNFIIGFPTETEEEFNDTLDFIREIDFDSGLIYPFSCKSGIIAEELEPKISEKEKLKRLEYSKEYLKKAGYHTITRNEISAILYGKKLISFD